MTDLLNAKELAAALGMSESAFHRKRQQKLMRMFEVKRPMGQRKYSRRLVERYLAGQPMARMGTGAQA